MHTFTLFFVGCVSFSSYFGRWLFSQAFRIFAFSRQFLTLSLFFLHGTFYVGVLRYSVGINVFTQTTSFGSSECFFLQFIMQRRMCTHCITTRLMARHPTRPPYTYGKINGSIKRKLRINNLKTSLHVANVFACCNRLSSVRRFLFHVSFCLTSCYRLP